MPTIRRTRPGWGALPLALAIAVVAVVVGAGVVGALWLAAGTPGRLSGPGVPEIPGPPPLPPLERHPVTTPVRVVLRDVDLTTGGARIRVPRLVVEAHLGGPGGPLVHVRSALVDRPRVTLPAAPGPAGSPAGAGPATGAGQGADRLARALFLDPGPRITADTIRVRDGQARQRAAPGEEVGPWSYRLRDIDLVLTDLAVGGGEDDRATLRLGLRGTRMARPLAISTLRARLDRTDDRLAFRTDARLGRTVLRAEGRVRPDGDLTVAVDADTVVFAEARALVLPLPGSGGARGRVRVLRSGGETALSMDDVAAEVGDSRAQASGTVVLGREPRARDLVVRSDGIDAADLERLGLDLPPGRYAGVLRADSVSSGTHVDASLERRPHPGAAAAGPGTEQDSRWAALVARLRDAPWRLSTDGVVRTRPRRVDLRVAASLPIGDSAVVAAGHVRGPLDRVAVDAVAALELDGRTGSDRGPVAASSPGTPPDIPLRPTAARPVLARVRGTVAGITGDRLELAGTVQLAVRPDAIRPASHASRTPLRAVATGRASLRDGSLDVALRADSIPLALVPTPSGVSGLQGLARADLRLTGERDRPAVGGVIDLLGGGARLEATGLEVTGGRGRVRLEDGAIILEDVAVAAGGGRITAGGRVVPGEVAGLHVAGAQPGAEPGAVDVAVTVDSVLVVDDSLARVGASGAVRIAGTVRAPRIDGRVTPSGWVREDYFKPEPGLDLDDPELAPLAARVPWPEDGRLRRAARESAAARDTAGSGGLSGRLVVEITRALRMIDEDSEIRGTGDLVLELGDPVHTRGRIAVEEGFYAQYGTVFRVYGGAFVFDGPGLRPRVALRSELDDEALLVGSDEAPTAPEREAPIRFFGYGEVGSALELVTRYTLVPRSQLELVRYVLLGLEPQPVEGWRLPLTWRPDAGAGVVGRRPTAQGMALGWSYVADQGYDYLPLDVGHFRAGVVTVGSRYPVRMQVTPLLKAAAVLSDRFELRLGQPLLGEAPRLSGVYRHAGLRLEAFTGPRFYPAAALGEERPGYTTRRRTGIAIRWGVQY